jgi:hypothetical protein
VIAKPSDDPRVQDVIRWTGHTRYAALVDGEVPGQDAARWLEIVLDMHAKAPVSAQPKRDVALQLELMQGCDYRGPVLQSGCNCRRVCYAGKGKKSADGDYFEVSSSDCALCVLGEAQ